MATRIKLDFKDASGKNQSFNYNYANSSAGASVRPLMEAMIANGDMFNTPPVAIVAATFITTTETPVSL